MKHHRILLLVTLLLSCRDGEGQSTVQPGETGSSEISLAIVFDSTGSMGNDLKQVKLGARRILKKHQIRGTLSLIKDYILVQVHDPDVGPAKVTTQPRTFNKFLDAVYTQGGGDCPEMTITGIKMALENARPNSLIYVFTDSSAKDYQLTPQVLELIQKKQSQVVFVLTGFCNSTEEPGFEAYQQIATISSGQVYIIGKGQVNEFMKVVESAVETVKVHILQEDTRKSGSKTYTFPVDSHLTHLTVQVTNYKTNDSITVKIRDPQGKLVSEETGLKRLMQSVPSVFFGSIGRPQPGLWTLEVSTTNNWHSVRVTGISEVDFNHGFATTPIDNNMGTSSQPIKGSKNYMMANITGSYHPGSIDVFDILFVNGSSVVRLPVNQTSHNQIYISRYPFDAPKEGHYYIKVSGQDSQGFKLQRYSKIALSSRNPRPISVTCPGKIEVKRGETKVIGCFVDSETPFTVIWHKDNRQLRGYPGENMHYKIPTNVSYIITNANEDSQGVYTSEMVPDPTVAVRLDGGTKDETAVIVLPPPPRVLVPRNASVEPGTDAELVCNVFSLAEEVTIRWFRDAPRFELRNSKRIHIEMNLGGKQQPSTSKLSKLRISGATANDGGRYICQAEHKGGSSSASGFVNIHVPPKVTVDAQTVTFSDDGTISLTCRTDGTPMPKLTWTFNDQTLESGGTISIVEDYLESRLTIRPARQSDEGRYICTAENSAGKHDTSVNAQYIALPDIQRIDFSKEVPVEGETLTIRCYATGIPSPKVKWEFNGSPVSDDGNIRLNDSVHLVEVMRLNRNMKGNWTCVAENSAGARRKTLQLRVEYAPKIEDGVRQFLSEYGDNLTLPCRTSADPASVVRWYRGSPDQQMIPLPQRDRFIFLPDNSLFITGVTMEDKSLFTCQAVNAHGRENATFIVDVGGIRAPTISFTQPKQIALDGVEEKILTCTVLDAKPPATVVWLKGDREIVPNSKYATRESSLIIRNVGVEDESVYTCIAKNDVGKAKFDIELDVQTKPIIDGERREVRDIIQGEKLELFCRVKSDPPPKIEWRKDGKPLQPDGSSTFIFSGDGTQLTIYSVTEQNSGTFTCAASNPHSVDVKEFRITVKTPPIIAKEGQPDHELGKDEVAYLNCLITTGQPVPRVEWYKNGQPVTPVPGRVVLTDNGNTLEIYGKVEEDSGSYECRAVNEAGSDSRIFQVTVLIPPVSSANEVIKKFVNVGDVVNLECKITGYPPPRKVWLWQDQRLNLENNPFGIRPAREDTKDLVISQMREELQGKYVCEGSNKAGTATIRYEVIILRKPDIVDFKDKAVVFIKNTITLTCQANGSPKPKISWMFNGREIPAGSPGYKWVGDNTLLVTSAEPRHGGTYSCIASNEGGRDKKDSIVTVFVPNGVDANGRQAHNSTVPPVLRGGNITFTCVMNSTPPAEIRWYKNNIDIHQSMPRNRFAVSEDGSTLTLYGVQDTDEGQFKCLAVNIPGFWGMNFTLLVQISPVIIPRLSSKKVTNVIKGEELQLRCWAEGAPVPTYTWFRNNQQLVAGGRLSLRDGGKNLVVLDTRKDDEGAYTCRAMNAAGQATLEVAVNVLVPPTFSGTSDRETHDLERGKPGEIHCNVSGSPRPMVRWEYELPNVEGSKEILKFNDDQKLYFPVANNAIITRYICIAKNDAGESRKVYDLNLVYPPVILNPDSESRLWILRGKGLRLACDSDAIPSSTTEWFKDGELIKYADFPRINITTRNTQLHLVNAQETDAGNYKCIVTNKLGQAKSQWTVEIIVPPSIRLSTHEGEHRVPLGSTLTLFCVAQGRPKPTLEWSKDGHPVDQRVVTVADDAVHLVINTTRDEDAGRYSCQAQSKYGQDTRFFDVKVTYAPRLDADGQRFAKVERTVGGSALLECLVSGSPQPTIEWYRDGVLLEQLPSYRYRFINNRRQLEVVSMQSGDAGRYTCVARNTFGQLELTMDVSVGAPARIDRGRIRTEYTVKLGDELQLPCPASGAPRPDISFSKGGVMLAETSRGPDYAGSVSRRHILSTERQLLTIFRVEKSDTGTYQCNASNPVGWDVMEYLVRVRAPPVFDTSNIQAEVHWYINQTRSLECTFMGVADPTPKVTWERHGAPVVEGPNLRVSPDGTRLTVQDVQQYDAGEYRCSAQNDVGKISQTFTVLVFVKPRFFNPVRFTLVEAVQNQTVQLSCEATGQPRPRFTWYRNEREIPAEQIPFPNFGMVRGEQVLQITNIQVYDRGDYTCTASNGGGTVEKKFNVTVIVPPRIMKRSLGPEEHRTQEYVAATFYCPVYNFNQTRPTMTWTKDGVPILVGDTDFYLTHDEGQGLTVMRPGVQEAGQYRCQARNKAGEDSHSFDLKVIAAPRFPSDFVRYREKLTVQLGSRVLFNCPATGSPDPIITWFAMGLPVLPYASSKFVLSEDMRTFTLPSVGKDAGEYRCYARNEGGNVTKVYDLEVVMPPLVRLDKSEVREREGSTFTVQCTAEGYPDPSIEWTRDGAGIFRLGTRADSTTGLLTVTDARKEDNGRYTCTATNKVSQDSKTVDVFIIERPTIQSSTGPIMAKEGDQVLLPCQVRGSPVIRVQWILPTGQQIAQSVAGEFRLLPDQGLVVERVKKEHAGRYRCSASNEAGYQDATVNLDVLISPKLSRPSNLTLVGLLDSVLQVQCKVEEGLPTPTVKWERNGVPFGKTRTYYTTTESGLFVFNSLKDEDEGDLTCVAKNAAGEDRLTFRIIVHSLPRVSLPVSTLGYEDQQVNIKCLVEGRPEPEVTWEVNGQSLNVVLGSRYRQDSPSEITIRELKVTDVGNYFCIGRRQGADTVRASTYLTVFTKPVFRRTPNQVIEMYEDRWIQFRCQADANPKPEIKWLHNGSPVSSNPSSNGIGSLVLGPLRSQNSGEYACVAKNEAGKLEFRFRLTVKSRPQVTLYQSDEQANDGGSTNLRCEVRGEADSIVWLKDGVLVTNSSRISITNNSEVLAISHTVPGDTGTYQCIATNPVGEDQGEVKLVVPSKPRLTLHPVNSSATLGDILVLDCTAEGHPSPVITWYKNKRPVLMDATHSIVKNGSLRMVAVSQSSEGVYQCAASNDKGEAYSEAALVSIQVHGGWSEWSEWGACSRSCGHGVMTRQRNCSNPAPRHGGRPCKTEESGIAEESRQCLLKFCPTDGAWSAWAAWSSCSTSCGSGIQQRTRRCDSPPPANDGKPCRGEPLEDVLCEGNPTCPVSGAWSPWTPWSECTQTCGEGGTQRRSRRCDSPAPTNGGFRCPGKDMMVRACSRTSCPLSGGWGEWGPWSICSRSCGTGKKRRLRVCDSPSPAFGGAHCLGEPAETSDCNSTPCPVNGEWSNWSSWSPCSRPCGPGIQDRERRCSEPAPDHGGRWCRGASKEARKCTGQSCNGGGGGSGSWRWSRWSAWSACSKTCGAEGYQTRSRVCEEGSCVGEDAQSRKCPDMIISCSGRHGESNYALGEIRGSINGENVGLILLNATWFSDASKRTMFDIVLSRIRPKDMHCIQILTGLLSPLLWNAAYEAANASNGQSVTSGAGHKHSATVQFADGKTLTMNHHVRQANGITRQITDVAGWCPLPPGMNGNRSLVELIKFKEIIVQMNSALGMIHADSSRAYKVNGTLEPYMWSTNMSVGPGNRQRYLVQQLLVDDLRLIPDTARGTVRITASAVIAKDDNGNSCPHGFELIQNHHYCQDVNECENPQLNQCDQLCVNTVPLHRCHCRAGYLLGQDGRSCIDVDECQTGQHTCTTARLCINTDGGFRCAVTCSKGLRLRADSGGCEDIDECRETPFLCGDHRCVNTYGGYTCHCKPGFKMTNGTCQDVDECTEQLHRCGGHQRCINVPGQYICHDACPSGYRLTADGNGCQDIDECSGSLQGGQCPAGAQCFNLPGTYRCECLPGFQIVGQQCVDIDECSQKPAPCSSYKCRNLPGSYECICPANKKSTPDKKGCIDVQQPCRNGFSYVPGQGCVDVDECSPISGPSPCQFQCHNTYGGYRCECPSGYTLVETTNTCQDIDECRLKDDQCGPKQLCLNTLGNFSCVDVRCPDKYVFDKRRRACKILCQDSTLPCPGNALYAEMIQFLIVNMPSQRDTSVKVRVVNSQQQLQPYCRYQLLESSPDIPFTYRSEGGVVYLAPVGKVVAPQTEKLHFLFFRVTCFANPNYENLIFQNSFYIYISISKYSF